MNEFELIARLTRALPSNNTVVAGPGDDCAVLDLGMPNQWLLFKTDAVVDGVHFNADTPAEKIGRKALGRCLSDIAAMAGTPVAAVITLGLPQTFAPDFIEKIYGGLGELAKAHGVAIVGGETTATPDKLFISVALLGTVARNKAVPRTGAKPGDAIFVTGELGGSIAGKHLEFEPRLSEGRWLAEHFPIHAMIDLSDGLAGDLRHLLKAGHLGAEILKSAVPIARAAKLRSQQKPPFSAALTDGEDFELLFTLESKHAVPLLDAWKQQFPKLKLSCIGKMVAGEGITICDKTGAHRLAAGGYEHFAGAASRPS